MPSIAPLDPAAADARQKELLDKVKAALGVVPNMTRAMAHSPAVLDAYLAMSGALAKGRLDARAREAVALTAAGANACDYCASAHAAISAQLKVDRPEIERRLAGHSADPKLDAALVFARTVIAKRGLVAPADLAAVRAAGHDEGSIGEIIAHVALNLFTNYFNHVAGTEIDFPRLSAATHRVA